MTAFVPSSIARPVLRDSAFVGAVPASCAVSPRVTVGPTMRNPLDKYQDMSTDISAQKPEPSKPSSIWTSYNNTVKGKYFSPFSDTRTTTPIVPAFPDNVPALFSMQTVGAYITPARGGDPDNVCSPFMAADKYMAKCVTMQYKMTAVPTGEYSIRCTEGTVKMQAEEARSAALSADFRLSQRSTAQKFGDFTETRKKAIIACQGCSYEEKLVDRFPAAARAVVRGSAEAKGVCVRYAIGATPAEKYMAGCVDKQSKFRSVPFGVYDVLCSDGNAKSVAEYKRVSALSARFRAGQLSKLAKEQLKFDSAKYARDNFGHGCSYEEALFNEYPAVASSMRPDAARY